MSTETPPAAQKEPANPRIQQVRDLIATYKPHMQALLGKHLSVETAFQVASMAIAKNPKLADCTAASLLGCILESSRLGRQPGGGPGHTWLIPRKIKGVMTCTMIVDYRAIVDMIRLGNKVGPIMVEPVFENDAFDYGVGPTGPYVLWKPFKGDRGKVLGYFSGAWDKDNVLLAYVYKTLSEIDTWHRSKAGSDDIWKSDYPAMCKKTVLRPLGKLLPGTSPELQRAIVLDEKAELGIPQGLEILADPTTPPTPETQAPEEKPKAEMPKKASEVKAEKPAEKPKEEPKPAEKGSLFPSEVLLTNYSAKTYGKGVEVKGPKGESYLSEEASVAKVALGSNGAPLSILFWPGEKDKHDIEQLKAVKK